MPGIVINSNFDLNQSVPIDSRLIATSSSARDSILYKYEGLKVYLTDEKKTYMWNGTTWNVEGSGIYGGSGSILGDTLINFGTVSSTANSDSYELTFGTDFASTKSRFINRFYRHTTSIPNQEYSGVEFRQQLVYFNNSGSQRSSSYIGFNSLSPNNWFGDMTFNTGDSSVLESMRISKEGKVGIGTNDPKESLQIGAFPSQPSTLHNSYGSQSLPITFHKGGSAVIGYNWYYNGADVVFELKNGSSRISQSDGEVTFSHRQANSAAGDFVQSLHLSKNARVGIGTGFDNNNLPSYLLDVNGSFRSNSAIINTNLTASNIYTTSNYFLPNTGYRITSESNRPFVIKKNNTNLFYTSDTGSAFYTGLGVSGGDVNVDQSVTIQNGSLLVNNNGSITNYEDPTTLNPSGTFIYYSTNGTWTNTTNSHYLSGFTYSFNFYRVGALVNLDFTIKRIGTTNYNSSFYGWLIKFNNLRFKATSLNKGSGIGGVSGNALRAPIWCQVIPANTSGHPSSTGNDFWLKIGTFNPLSNTSVPTNQGGDFSGSVTDLYFSGTITYISSQNPTSNTTVAIPVGIEGNQQG